MHEGSLVQQISYDCKMIIWYKLCSHAQSLWTVQKLSINFHNTCTCAHGSTANITDVVSNALQQCHILFHSHTKSSLLYSARRNPNNGWKIIIRFKCQLYWIFRTVPILLMRDVPQMSRPPEIWITFACASILLEERKASIHKESHLEWDTLQVTRLT